MSENIDRCTEGRKKSGGKKTRTSSWILVLFWQPQRTERSQREMLMQEFSPNWFDSLDETDDRCSAAT